jgi:hypothetical protein
MEKSWNFVSWIQVTNFLFLGVLSRTLGNVVQVTRNPLDFI